VQLVARCLLSATNPHSPRTCVLCVLCGLCVRVSVDSVGAEKLFNAESAEDAKGTEKTRTNKFRLAGIAIGDSAFWLPFCRAVFETQSALTRALSGV